MKIIEELRNRKILKNITNEEKMYKLEGNESVYIGFDPTAISLHLGNYVQIVILKRFKQFGFKPIAVLGGATGMIGDPSGKMEERKFLDEKLLIENQKEIEKQLKKYGLDVVNNYEFYKDMNVLEFFRSVGKNLNINYMISKDAVASRLKKGISFTEFSYQLIQGWDFKKLYDNNNVRIQIGGSDQWGNITSGIELIRKTNGDENLALGITTNLLTTSNGEKFGKSEDNALWLDPKMTTPYRMYQYLILTTDKDVERFLNWLTFLNQNDINKIIKKHNKNKALRFAQKKLAYEVIKDIHSKDEADKSELLTKILFGKIDIKKLDKNDLFKLIDSIPTFESKDGNVLELLIETNLATSKREAREFVESGAVSINGDVIKDVNYIVNKYGYDNTFNLIKRGKKTILIQKT